MDAPAAVSLSLDDDRQFPERPIVAVSVAVFRGRKALIARRGRAPWLGAFSLPGGVVEVGVTLAEAVARELMEEVGVEARIVGFVRHVEPIHREGDRVRAHYIIAAFAAHWLRGEPRLSAEADEVAWVDPLDLGGRPTTPELADILAQAAEIASP